MSIVRRRRDQVDLSGVDWARVDATTDEDIVRWAEEDPDTPPPSTDAELAAAVVVRPGDRTREAEPDREEDRPLASKRAVGAGRR